MIRQLCCTHIPDIPKRSGIYIIHSRQKDEWYIGSSVNLHKRFRTHLFKLIKGNHPNQNIQKVFNKKQILFFSVSVLCSPMSLKRQEQKVLDRHKFNGKLLNRTRIASAHSGRMKK